MNFDETITTLQFASRAIKIKVNAHINEQIKTKKMKEKMKEFIKIKNLDSVIQENKTLEKDANDLKSSFNNIKNDLKKAKNRDKEEKSGDYSSYHSNNNNNNNTNTNNRSHTPEPRSKQYNTQNSNNEEYANITKKFHSLIIHLQNELSKSIVTIHNLQEENKMLKDKLSRGGLN
jgi:hypothetical protein